ncbi:MAG: hypothetical protein RIT27_862 [Pseudomonadota bacterium]|jgi:nucleotide-binding universal stress UspA family protein
MHNMLLKIKKILCALDLNEHAKITFRYAMSLAQQCQATVMLLHAIEPLNNVGVALLETYISQADIQQLHQEALETIKSNLQKRLNDFYHEESQLVTNAKELFDKIVILEGAPAKIIVEQSIKEKVDVIVMGTHHQSVVGEMLVGSTVRRVTHLSQIPVLIVPSFNQI